MDQTGNVVETRTIHALMSIPNAQKLRTARRHLLGSLIWLHRTQHDIGYDIAKIATDFVSACTDVDMALATLMLYNRTARFVEDYDRAVLDSSPGSQNDSFRNSWWRLQMVRSAVFADE